MWKTNEPQTLNRASLKALFDNTIPAIRIQAFATGEECRRFAESTGQHTMKPVVGDTDVGQAAFAAQRIDHLGITQAAFKRRGPDAYFTAATKATAETATIYAQSFNPLDRLIGLLASNNNGRVERGVEQLLVKMARENSGWSYGRIVGALTNLSSCFRPPTGPLKAETAACDARSDWGGLLKHIIARPHEHFDHA